MQNFIKLKNNESPNLLCNSLGFQEVNCHIYQHFTFEYKKNGFNVAHTRTGILDNECLPALMLLAAVELVMMDLMDLI